MHKGPKTAMFQPDTLSCSECFIDVEQDSHGTVTSRPAAFQELPKGMTVYTNPPGSPLVEHSLDYLDAQGNKFTLTIKATSIPHVKDITEKLRLLLRHAT